MANSHINKALSSLAPADNPAVIAHLNILQATITRLAGNSAQCKLWCLAIVSALFGLAGAMKNDQIIAAAIIPIVIFGLVDAAYLGHEKAYRELYNSVVSDIRKGNYTLNDCFNLTPSANGRYFGSALGSWSIWPIYLGLAIAYLLARMSGLLT